MRILVTGGAGYIGSHVCLKLLDAGYKISILDNLSNSSYEQLKAIEALAKTKIDFYKIDLLDRHRVVEVFENFKPDGVIHLAGKKSMSESIETPLAYYNGNINGTLSILNGMEQSGCGKIVFSSSASVYGKPLISPLDERHIISPENPYSWSKAVSEQIIKDFVSSSNKLALSLRYFNPLGAHESGIIGEGFKVNFGNIMPALCKVALAGESEFKIFGQAYDTKDGTGERDYIHVNELAEAHVLALKNIENINSFRCFNLGSSKGTTVLELVKAFERVTGIKIPYVYYPARRGDVASAVANPTLFYEFTGFKFSNDIEKMCRDSWRYFRNDEF